MEEEWYEYNGHNANICGVYSNRIGFHNFRCIFDQKEKYWKFRN